MHAIRDKLRHRFNAQAQFASDYSQLYWRLFATVGSWFDQPAADKQAIAAWLVALAGARGAFDTPLLLVAGLHKLVLAGRVPALAAFYPSAGGCVPDESQAAAFERTLLAAVRDERVELAAFIQSANVQTNETGRGIAWLLPLSVTGWPAVHLVDLGASAGLNLLAEQRHYELVTPSGAPLLALGSGAAPQFRVEVSGEQMWRSRGTPRILSRSGGDVLPFVLDSAEKEQWLAAYVWADQMTRWQRLQEGIAALHRVQQTAAPVDLHRVFLPDDLPTFLTALASTWHDDAPVVIYNTFITVYLRDKGAALRPLLHDWALRQPRPVLWLQWELARDGRQPPEMGWCAVSADLWQQQTHTHWPLGWVHAHGHALHLAAPWRDFCSQFMAH